MSLVSELQLGHSTLQKEATALQAQKEQTDKDKEVGGRERDTKEAAAIAARNLNLQVK